MNADGTNQQRLTNTLENDDSPSWSSDGTKIVFRSDREREPSDPMAQVWMMNADGSNQVDLSNNDCDDYSPDWQRVGSNLPPTVNITSPVSGAEFIAPANITITATATDSDGTISRVDFYQGTILLGTDVTAPYSLNWTDVAPGTYSLTAKATDNLGATTTSTTVGVTLNAPPPNVADVHWLVTDQLGTPRMVFDQSGSLANVSRHDYLPFGEELFDGTGGRTTAQGYSASDNVRQKFTQKERDVETGLDYFGARYHSSALGRFTTCDPVSLTNRHVVDPQKWNSYVYARNNPSTLSDPNGMDDRGEGGSRVIDVFLLFPARDRNLRQYDAKGNLTKEAPGPEPPRWDVLAQQAKDAGFTLRVWGPEGTGLPTPLKTGTDALQNSEMTLIIGHGGTVAQQPSGRLETVQLSFVGGSINAEGYGGVADIFGATGEAAETNSRVVGVFTCNSEDSMPSAFNMNSSSTQNLVTNTGGKDGGTSVITLEQAGYQFTKTYITTNGNVKAAAASAQTVINNSPYKYNDGDGDRIVVHERRRQ